MRKASNIKANTEMLVNDFEADEKNKNSDASSAHCCGDLLARSAAHAPAHSNAFVLCQAKKRLRCSGLGTRQTTGLDESRRRFLAMNL